MIGKYNVEIYNNKVHYSFDIKRNITIIQGDSATGKSTLISMIAAYERLGTGSGIVLKCEADCAVLGSVGWETIVSVKTGYIFFVEENMPYIRTKEFAEYVNRSDNYFVIFYRDSLPQLSYSIEEIYGIYENRESQKYIKAKKVYNAFYNIYNLKNISRIRPKIVITEDSNSGYEFFSNFFKCRCVSANGKSNVYKFVEELFREGNDGIVIVDGAAFGADIEKLLKTARKCNCNIYAPESFEYLLLSSQIMDFPEDELNNTFNYADSKLYLSWERFFTKRLSEITDKTRYAYSKSKLNPIYLEKRNVEKIKRVLPKIVLEEDLKC